MAGEVARDDLLRGLASSKEVRSLLRLPGTAVYVARRAGLILWASPNFPEVTGHAASDLVGRNAWDLLPAPEDLALAAEASSAFSEQDITVWLRLRRADGSKDWFRLDSLNRLGGAVVSFKREDNQAERYFHWIPYRPAKAR